MGRLSWTCSVLCPFQTDKRVVKTRQADITGHLGNSLFTSNVHPGSKAEAGYEIMCTGCSMWVFLVLNCSALSPAPCGCSWTAVPGWIAEMLCIGKVRGVPFTNRSWIFPFPAFYAFTSANSLGKKPWESAGAAKQPMSADLKGVSQTIKDSEGETSCFLPTLCCSQSADTSDGGWWELYCLDDLELIFARYEMSWEWMSGQDSCQEGGFQDTWTLW